MGKEVQNVVQSYCYGHTYHTFWADFIVYTPITSPCSEFVVSETHKGEVAWWLGKLRYSFDYGYNAGTSHGKTDTLWRFLQYIQVNTVFADASKE